MSATEEKLRAKIVDREVLQSAGLVTYVVDVWRGDREDPATPVTRYIGVWKSDQLEGDPTISMSNPGGYSERITQKPEAMVWEKLETVKIADKEAQQFKDHHEH